MFATDFAKHLFYLPKQLKDKTTMKKILSALMLCAAATVAVPSTAQQVEGFKHEKFYPRQLWFDTDGRVINAHGGGVLYRDGHYYWYGEHKGEHSNSAFVGVTCYSSTDLYNWKNEGTALSVSSDTTSAIASGCIIERPKVIYCERTGKYVMYFHLELRGKGYGAAHCGVAVSDTPTGPFTLVSHGRVNPGKYPENFTKEQRKMKTNPNDYKWWSKEWYQAMEDGLFVRRDLKDGQMARDMTLYVDDDGKAYHIYSSEDNLTLQIAELSDDYLTHTGRYWRLAPAGHNEAPAIFKKDGKYHMITSGCTGWAPNAARLFTADKISGPWTQHPNPCQGNEADKTFQGQSTFIFPVQGKKDTFIFMADNWRPENPIDGRYIWLPIKFGDDGLPTLTFEKEWTLE